MSMPSPSNIPNITRKLNSKPMKYHSTPKAVKNENGIAIPTIKPFLRPRAATTSNITRITAVMILPCSSLTISAANFVVSSPGVITNESGYSLSISATSFFTAFAISSSLKPTRLVMFSEIESNPLTLEKDVGSLNVRFISATSPRVTTFEPDALIGKLNTSCLVSKILGISTANFPDPVS